MIMQKYDKKRLINNLYYYLKKNNIKVGDLEEAANVSIGYLSRWKNDGNENSAPSIDTLTIMAEKLGTTLDNLLFSELNSLTNNEIKVIDFLDAFIKKTEMQEIEWEKISIIQAHGYFKNNKGNYFLLPFMKENTTLDNSSGIDYISLFDFERYTLIDNVLRAYKNGKTVYLTKINKIESFYDSKYELYMHSDELKKICRSNDDIINEINKKLEELYNLASCSSRTNKIDKDLESDLNDFIYGIDESDI